MDYQSAMNFLSQCNLGAILLSFDHTILAINQCGKNLFQDTAPQIGDKLPEYLHPLTEDTSHPPHIKISFQHYIQKHKIPVLCDLPYHTELLVFRNSSNEVLLSALSYTMNQLHEAVIICDEDNLMYYFNNAASAMDSLVEEEILGKNINEVYLMKDNGECIIPMVIREKRPYLDHRQHYSTCYGKQVDIVSNTYPIIKKNQVLGGVNIFEDWSTIDDLHKQILDLQEKLLFQNNVVSKNKNALPAQYHFSDILHISDNMRNVIAQCMQVARSDSSVLIYGETGTGKELFAQSIHNASKRAEYPFLAVNCAAIPENLLESLLFGSVKGAYTGAETKAGLFEQANHGTLLLDEINSMNIHLQSRLLRVLQDGIVRRVGGNTEIKVDVRVISNINTPPYQAIAENKLRLDLFYRLGVVNINIPPLRERKKDIPLLSKNFILKYNKKILKSVDSLEKEVLECFQSYDWPGNIRELQHAIEHAMNVIPDDITTISLEYIPAHISDPSISVNSPRRNLIHEPQDTVAFLSSDTNPDDSVPSPMKDTVKSKQPERHLKNVLRSAEYDTLLDILTKHNGNISASARSLGISRQSMQYRIRRYHIDVKKFTK